MFTNFSQVMLVRHGRPGSHDYSTDPGLDQAVLFSLDFTGEAIEHKLQEGHIGRVMLFSSEPRRVQETAEHLQGYLSESGFVIPPVVVTNSLGLQTALGEVRSRTRDGELHRERDARRLSTFVNSQGLEDASSTAAILCTHAPVANALGELAGLSVAEIDTSYGGVTYLSS